MELFIATKRLTVHGKSRMGGKLRQPPYMETSPALAGFAGSLRRKLRAAPAAHDVAALRGHEKQDRAKKAISPPKPGNVGTCNDRMRHARGTVWSQLAIDSGFRWVTVVVP